MKYSIHNLSIFGVFISAFRRFDVFYIANILQLCLMHHYEVLLHYLFFAFAYPARFFVYHEMTYHCRRLIPNRKLMQLSTYVQYIISHSW